MSNTPRTDAAAKQVGLSGVDWHHSATMMRLHAMTLEEELNAANKRHNDALIHATNAERHLSAKLEKMGFELALAQIPTTVDAVEREEWRQERERLQAAAVPLCIGEPIIRMLASQGQYISDDGRAIIAADCLFRKDPYAERDEARAEKEMLKHRLDGAVWHREKAEKERDAARAEVKRMRENRPAENQILLAQIEAQVGVIRGYRHTVNEKCSERDAAVVERDAAMQFVKHMANRSCNCQHSAPDVDENRHGKSCMVGKAQRMLGKKVTERPI